MVSRKPGSSPNTLAQGSDAVYQIVINGELLPGEDPLATDNLTAGLTLVGDDNTIRGLGPQRLFGLLRWTAISGSTETSLKATSLVHVTGTWRCRTKLAFALVTPILRFALPDEQPNRRQKAAARNLISGNEVAAGVRAGTNNVFEGNYVGTDANGTAATKPGRLVLGSRGLKQPDWGNCCGGGQRDLGQRQQRNGLSGPAGPGGGNNVVQGNRIGTDIGGTPRSETAAVSACCRVAT